MGRRVGFVIAGRGSVDNAFRMTLRCRADDEVRNGDESRSERQRSEHVSDEKLDRVNGLASLRRDPL